MSPIAEESIMPDRWLSVDEIVTHFGVSEAAICKRSRRKTMRQHKLSRLRKVMASEVDEWVDPFSSACHMTLPIPASISGIRDKAHRDVVPHLPKVNIHIGSLFRLSPP